VVATNVGSSLKSSKVPSISSSNAQHAPALGNGAAGNGAFGLAWALGIGPALSKQM